MAVFRPVAWQPNEPVTKEKLDQLSSNQQYLFENTSNMVYRSEAGIRTTTGLKLIAGIGVMTPTKNPWKSITISYAGEFDSGVKPIITTGVQTTVNSDNEHTLVTRQITDQDCIFSVDNIRPKSEKGGQMISGTMYIHYMAMGISTRITAAPE